MRNLKFRANVEQYCFDFMKSLAVVGGIAAATLSTATPSHAFSVQTVGPVSFTTPPTAQNLVFPNFTAASPNLLTGVKFVLADTQFGGTAIISNFFDGGGPVNVTAAPTFKIAAPGPVFTATGTSSAVGSSLATIGANPAFSSTTLSGAYSGSFSSVSTPLATQQNYFATGTVTVNNASVAFASSPYGFNPSAAPNNPFLTGKLYLQYEYVPGPLPILGAGAAFGWSRRLRKRIRKVA